MIYAFRAILITYLSLISSCGVLYPKNSSSDDNGSPTPETKTSSQAGGGSYIADSESDLSPCDNSRYGVLVYLKNPGEFRACYKESGWTRVDIKGPKGDKGDSGSQGTQGTAGTIVNGNMWYDTIDQKYWLIPSLEKAPTNANLVSQCGSSSNYRLPTYQELMNANTRGLKTAADNISAPKEAWVLKSSDASQNGSAGSWQNDGSGNLLSEQYVRTGNTIDNLAGFYCIQK